MKTITKTTTTSLSFSDIVNIIDEHFETETNLLFVTNKQLAEEICDYVLNEYNIIDESMEINDEILDYYITIYFEDDNINFFCEDARGITGEYKLHYVENEYIDYYICVDMEVNVVFDKLMGINGSWNWISVDLEDNDYECDNCKYEGTDECCECGECSCDCEECEDEGITYDELLDIFVDKIVDTQGCLGCIREVLDEFADIFIPDEEYDCEKECDVEIVCDDICEDCEIPKDLCKDVHIVEDIATEYEDSDCQCESCLRNTIYKALMVGKEIGYEDCKEYIKEFVDEV